MSTKWQDYVLEVFLLILQDYILFFFFFPHSHVFHTGGTRLGFTFHTFLSSSSPPPSYPTTVHLCELIIWFLVLGLVNNPVIVTYFRPLSWRVALFGPLWAEWGLWCCLYLYSAKDATKSFRLQGQILSLDFGNTKSIDGLPSSPFQYFYYFLLHNQVYSFTNSKRSYRQNANVHQSSSSSIMIIIPPRGKPTRVW